MFKNTTNGFKDSFKLTLPWAKTARALRKSARKDQTYRVVEEGVTREEYALRYGRVRFSAFAAAGYALASFIIMLFSSTLQVAAFCLLATILFFMFYVRYAMVLWISRCCWNSWDKRHREVKIRGEAYFKTILKDPRQLMPLALPDMEISNEE